MASMVDDISIILPIYNVEKYIEKCIVSLLNQTSKAFEVVLVDDGGQDQSVEICEKLLKNSGIEYHIESKIDANGTVLNCGLAAARNLGVQKAKFEWVICIDSDDYIHPQTVELFQSAINAYRDASVIFCDYERVTENYKKDFPKIECLPMQKIEFADLANKFYNRKEHVIVPSMLLNKTFVIERGLLFPEDCRFSEDGCFTYRLLNNDGYAVKICQTLYEYVQRETSIMNASGIDKIMTGYHAFVRLDKELSISDREWHIDKHMVLHRWVLGTANSISKIMKYGDFVSTLEQMQVKKHMKALINSSKGSVWMRAMLLYVSPYLFYSVMNKVTPKVRGGI